MPGDSESNERVRALALWWRTIMQSNKESFRITKVYSAHNRLYYLFRSMLYICSYTFKSALINIIVQQNIHLILKTFTFLNFLVEYKIITLKFIQKSTPSSFLIQSIRYWFSRRMNICNVNCTTIYTAAMCKNNACRGDISKLWMI